MHLINNNQNEQFNKYDIDNKSHFWQSNNVKNLLNINPLDEVNIDDFFVSNNINAKLNNVNNMLDKLSVIKTLFNNANMLKNNNINLNEEKYLSATLNDRLKSCENQLENFKFDNLEAKDKINNLNNLLNKAEATSITDNLKLQVLNGINTKKDDVSKLIWSLDISLVLIVLLEQSIKVTNSMSRIIKEESKIQQVLNDKLQSMTAFLTAMSRIYSDAVIIYNKDRKDQEKKKDINWEEIPSNVSKEYHWSKNGNNISFDKDLFVPSQSLIDGGYIKVTKDGYTFNKDSFQMAVKDLTKEINEILGRNLDPEASASLVLSSVSIQNLIDQQTQTGQRIMTQQNAFISSLQQMVDIVNTLVEISNRCIGQLIIGNKS